MELRQLEYFQMASRLRNITRAAKRLKVSQPNITVAIKKLETEDTALELRLEQLETEHKALEVEIESLDKVIDNDVEEGFKTFG